MQQYCQAKGNDEEEFIKKYCQCPHSYHANTFNTYQATHKSSLSSVSVIKEYRDLINVIKPKEPSLTTEEEEKVNTDLKKARSINSLSKATPKQDRM
jgi:type IV secretory pathway component VirB8